MRYYKTNDIDLKDYSNNLVNDENTYISNNCNIIYYYDQHVETLMKMVDNN